eukprot:scaffold301881_cov33-Tisochrysis_lutea.AAC.1
MHFLGEPEFKTTPGAPRGRSHSSARCPARTKPHISGSRSHRSQEPASLSLISHSLISAAMVTAMVPGR